MSETATPGVDPQDHREEVDWVALSKSHGTERRLHKVKGDPGPDELENGEECEVACGTSLTSNDSTWRAKPAAVYPPGFHPLCQNGSCFGEEDS